MTVSSVAVGRRKTVRLRVVRRATIGVLTAFLVTACAPPTVTPRGDDIDPNGTMVWSAGEPSIIDPQRAQIQDSITVASLVYESLLAFDPTTLRPAAGAASLPSISGNGLVYHFTLREGLTYSDGLPVKASDFAYGISRLCDPAVAAIYASFALAIDGCDTWSSLDATKAPPDQLAAARRNLFATGIVVLGDRALELRLREPAPYLSSFLALWLSAPVRQADVERVGENWWLDPASYIGNGPFVMVEWVQGSRIVFERNARYRTPVKLKRLTRRVFADQRQALNAYQGGTIDRVTSVDAELLPAIRIAGLESEVSISPVACTYWVRLNHARPPLDDPKVRLALAKSIDRDAYTREVRAFSRIPSSFIPVGLPGHDPSDVAQSFDLTAAKRALSESRYAGSDLLRQMVWPVASNAPALRKNEAQWTATQWRALGIDVRVEIVDPVALAELNRAIQTRAMFTLGGWCADYPDQQDWFSVFFTARAQRGTRDFGYRNSSVDALLTEADHGVDPAKRDELYLSVSRTVSAEVGLIWLAYGQEAALNKPWVGGLNESAFASPGQLRPADIFVKRH